MADNETSGGGGSDFAAIYSEIQSILGDDKVSDGVADENSFEYPTSDVMGLMPDRYIREGELSDCSGETVVLSMEDLYNQLARGKVEMSVSQIAYFLPMHTIYQAAMDDQSMVELPLASVVNSVGLEKIIDHTPKDIKTYNIATIDDIFTKGDAVAAGDVDDDDDDGPVVLFADEQPEEVAESEATKAPEPEIEKVPEPEPEPEVVAEVEEVREEKPPSAKKAGLPVSFDYPVASVIKSVPKEWLVDNALELVGDKSVEITLIDLSDQLKKGEVSVDGKLLAIQLPPEMLTEAVSQGESPEIALNLKLVVEALGIDSFETSDELSKDYNIDWMVDPFEKPDVLPKLERKKAKPVRTPEVPTARRPVEQLQQKEVPYERLDEDGPESEFNELPGNVNINAAAIDELMSLDGMTAQIAEQIVSFRQEHKGFKTIFQLHRVSGVDENIFEQLSGIPAEQKRFHRRRRLVNFLKIPAKRVADLGVVAHALAEKSGFAASIISDADGLVMAEYGVGETGYDLSAILPSLISQVRHNLDLADLGGLDSMTLRLDRTFFTFVPLSNVTLTVIHEDDQLSRNNLELIEKVAKELEWLLSVRAYVGPYVV